MVKYSIRLDSDRLPMLVKEAGIRYGASQSCNSPELIVDFLREKEGAEDLFQENVWLFCLNMKYRLIGYFNVSHGSSNTSLLPIKEVFLMALACGASRIVLAHNHPSGDPTPSKADSKGTANVKRAGELLGIQLIDHIVIGIGTYYSFAQEGVL